ncbi:LysE family translocator, partial [Xanthomonas citri pv. citri]
LLGREPDAPELETGPASRGRLFAHGVIVNVLNPKSALFFLAFLPQFVDPSAGAVAPQMLVLGLLLVSCGGFSDGTFALLAASIGNRLKARRRLERISGAVFVSLGVVAALAGEPKQS